MPLSPTATRDQLAQLGHTPKRFLGQNFLVDGNIVRKSIELAQVQAGDTVVEIGPGLGTLTAALLEAGASVWAVEKDRTLYAHLAATLGPRFPDRLHLLEGDAVEHPLAGLPLPEAGCPHPAQLNVGRVSCPFDKPFRPAQDPEPVEGLRALSPPKGTRRGVSKTDALQSNPRGEGTPPPSPPPPDFKIVANLPYAIATPWLDAVLAGPLPARLVLMLQQEAAQRYTARPGTKSFGAISVFLQAAYGVAPGHKVATTCFFPRPAVESQLLNLVRQPDPFVFDASTKALIRGCFQQRRKQIGTLLRHRLATTATGWRELLHTHGLSEQTRPEAIPVAWWKEFSRLSPPLT